MTSYNRDMGSMTVSATEFKAKCLKMLDQVDKGETITVTKRGRAVAIVQPVRKTAWKSPAGILAGRLKSLATS